MKYVRGFLMAWGCFCWIPCPYKKWNEDDRIPMVAMLPLVGTGLGLVTALVWWIIGILTGMAEAPWVAADAMGAGTAGAPGPMDAASAAMTGAPGPMDAASAAMTGAPGPMNTMGAPTIFGPAAPGAISAAPLLCGAVVTAAYFVMTGFIHLDGFMDVSDAVMPRHPRIEERVRILKDPHTGSFAAISMALMFLIFGASAAALSRSWAAGALILIAVATTSRCVSAISVICCEPMQTSQYAKAGFPDETSFPKALPALIIAVLVTAACVCAALLLPETLLGLPKGMAGMAGMAGMPGALLAWSVIGSAAVCAITAVIIGALDRKALGGMNGDISGHLITSGEMAGMLAAAIFLT